jgi:hypothetical protein
MDVGPLSYTYLPHRVLTIIAIIVLAMALMIVCLDDRASAVDKSTYVQEVPGELEYDYLVNWTVWSSDKKGEPSLKPGTRLLSADVDRKPGDELLFGGYNGTLLVIDAWNGVELVNLSLPEDTFAGPLVGELDGDDSTEIIFATHKFLYCYDFDDRRIQWKRDYYQSSPCYLVDYDGDGMDEILMQSNKNFRLVDNDGKEIYNISLDIFNETVNSISDPIVEDIDRDGDLEVILVSRGMAWMWPGIGRHIWIIDLASGQFEYTRKFDDVVFQSYPIIMSWNGSLHLAVGLLGDRSNNSSELMLFDLINKTYELHSLFGDIDEYDRYTNFICLVPSDEGPLVFASIRHEHFAAWSVADKKVLWNRTVPRSRAQVRSPAVSCDIDGDGDYEVLVPNGPLYVIDAISGNIENKIQFSLQWDRLHPYSEHRLTVGDFDGDGFTEIVGGNKNWLKTDRYDFLCFDNAPMRIYLDGATEGDRKVFYAGMEHHLLFGITNFSVGRTSNEVMVTFHNDPRGTILRVLCYPENGSISIMDNELLQDLTVSFAFINDMLILDLSLTPSWNYSFEGFNDVTLNFTTRTGSEHGRMFTEAFRVERDLVLAGEPSSSWIQGPLESDEWILPGETIETTGMDVTYEGTADVRPPVDAFMFEVNVDGTIDNISFQEGQAIDFFTKSPGRDGPFILKVRLLEVYLGTYGDGSYKLRLNVDGTPPALLDLHPENGTWFSTEVIVIAFIVDDLGCGIDTGSVRYRMGADGTEPPGEWQNLKRFELSRKPEGWMVLKSMKLEEGQTLLEWEVSDMLGLVWAFNITVGVDLHGVLFKDFSPVGWANTSEVEVSITVEDIGGSGVNGSSIQYSYSTDGLFSFTDWMSVGPFDDGQSLEAFLVYSGEEGKDNIIRFRGRDMAGNEVISSSTYEVWIDSTSPNVTIKHPSLEEIVDPSNGTIRTMVYENGSGLDVIDHILIDESTGERIDITKDVEMLGDGWHSLTARYEPSGGPWYTYEVRSRDIAGNTEGLVAVRFKVNEAPTARITSPVGDGKYLVGTEIFFNSSISDPDDDDVDIVWILDGSLTFTNVTHFHNDSIEAGNHTIRLTVNDPYYQSSHEIQFQILEAPEPPPVDDEEPVPYGPRIGDDDGLFTNPMFWLIILVITSAFAVGFIHIHRSSDPK